MANTYYCDSTAADDTGDGTIGSPFKTLAHAVAHATGVGDTVYLKRGSTWREQLTIPAASQTWTAYDSGNLPRIWGSAQVSTWSNHSGSIWSASYVGTPLSLWVVVDDNTTKWGEKHAAHDDCTALYDWADEGNVLYINTGGAGNDPDTLWQSVEVPVRQYGVYSNNKSNVTISYLDIAFVDIGVEESDGIYIYRGDSVIVEYNNVHHIGDYQGGGANDPYGNGIDLNNLTNSNVRYNTIRFAGRRGIVSWAKAVYAHDNNIIEHNTVSNCGHAHIDNFLQSDGTSFDGNTIRANYVYTDSDYCQGYATHLENHGIFVAGPGATSDLRVTNQKVYNNIVKDMYDGAAISFDRRVNIGEVYNNTVYGYHTGSSVRSTGYYFNSTSYVSNIKFNNNIGSETYLAILSMTSSAAFSECNNNLWFKTDTVTPWITITGSTNSPYFYDEFAAYKTATGWDTNGKWEDPHFTTPGTDFTLLEGSPCIDTGADLSAVGVTDDYIGTSRPQGDAYDIGAYEYNTIVSASISPSSSPSLSPSASVSPSRSPSRSPSLSPSGSPSRSSSLSPSRSPSLSPSKSPSFSPSRSPSVSPSSSPSLSPSSSLSPSVSPSNSPSLSPSSSISPSSSPSLSPSVSPSESPSASPSMGWEYAKFKLVGSPYIIPSGDYTTTQLNAPSGKVSGTHFKEGRIQDDENPCDPIDLTLSLGSENATNGNMELDSNWTDINSPETNERSGTLPYSGSYSRHVVDSTPSYGGIRNTTFTSTTGKTYRIACWYKLTSGILRVIWTRGVDGTGINLTSVGVSLDWAYFEYDHTETSGGSNASVVFINNSDSNAAEFYIDDVSIKEIYYKYTEIEWCIEATQYAVVGDTYEFRVTRKA